MKDYKISILRVCLILMCVCAVALGDDWLSKIMRIIAGIITAEYLYDMFFTSQSVEETKL